MGGRTGRVAVALASLIVLVGEAGAWPGLPSVSERIPRPAFATSGNNSELIERVAVTRRPGARERVAMRISPSALDPIEAGDRLRVSGEVQVSTTCVEPGRRCVGRSYDVNPTVIARIVLSRSHNRVSRHQLPLSGRHSVLCKQMRPNRNHHCTVTIPNSVTRIRDLSKLPCRPDACHVNLLLSARNRRAQPRNFVVLGGDRPDGSVAQDKGRLTVVQTRAATPPPASSARESLVRRRLPLTIDDADKRRVVYSVPIRAPRRGEVVAFDSSFVGAISALRFNTFLTSRVIVATEPRKTRPTGQARTEVSNHGQATESNGFNCTLGVSGFANPCTTRKSGAVRFEADVVDRGTGAPKTLYLNVIAGAKPLLAEYGVKRANKVSLAPQPGGLTVWRYARSGG